MKPVSKISAVAVTIALAAGLGVYLPVYLRSRPVWYVEASNAAAWTRIISRGAPHDMGGPPFTRVRLLKENAPAPRGPGFIITSANAAVFPNGADDYPQSDRLVCYGQLSHKREYNGALLLALDPWLVFCKHGGSTLRYDRVTGPGGGNLILPGAETEALWAWTAQLMQRKSGIFAEDQRVWRDAGRRLTADRRFQNGAENCRWPEALAKLLREGDAWLYAPLSRVLELPSYRSAMLTARHFPVPLNWNQYGLQASLLWAIPSGKPGRQKKLAAAEAWLTSPRTQTLIAAEFRWLPANPESRPANPLYRDAQFVWFSSSVVWQPDS